jgi:hypothetical protein
MIMVIDEISMTRELSSESTIIAKLHDHWNLAQSYLGVYKW